MEQARRKKNAEQVITYKQIKSRGLLNDFIIYIHKNVRSSIFMLIKILFTSKSYTLYCFLEHDTNKS